MQDNITIGRIQLHWSAERQTCQHSCKSRIPHAGGYHSVVLKRCTGQWESSYIPFGISFRWTQKGKVCTLSGCARKSCRFCKIKYHGSCGNLFFAKLFHRRNSHIFFFRLPVPPAAANLSRNAVGGLRPIKPSPLLLVSGVWSAR